VKFLRDRVSRSTYCLLLVGYIVGGAVLSFVMLADLPDAVVSGLAIIFLAGFGFLFIHFGIARLHDFDKSGWWLLLWVVPLANLVLFIMLLARPGTQGDNRFGPPNA
jgi:uncharacterized membrane protein YhaH (DUF805 family)